MNQFELVAEPRTDMGKGASRRLRRAGQVPAILYGADKEPQSLSVPHNVLIKQLENEAFYSHVLTLKVGGQTEKAVLKDLQRHPFKPWVTHADFQRVSETSKLHMHIPLHFTNEALCVGVKTGGGVVSHQMVEVVVECLPKDLPEFIEVDMTDVQLGQVIHLADLKLPPGVEIPALRLGEDHNLPVVTIHKGHGGAAEEEESAPAPAA